MSGAAKRLRQDGPSSSAAHTQFGDTTSRGPDRAGVSEQRSPQCWRGANYRAKRRRFDHLCDLTQPPRLGEGHSDRLHDSSVAEYRNELQNRSLPLWCNCQHHVQRQTLSAHGSSDPSILQNSFRTGWFYACYCYLWPDWKYVYRWCSWRI